MGRNSLRICSLLCSQVDPSLVVCHLLLLSFPCTQSFGQELATSLRQIFPRLPKGNFPRFPLDLYPLPMYQIIYRKIYLLYVLVEFVGKAKEPPIHSLTLFVTFGLFLSFTAYPHWAFHHTAVELGPYGTATKKKKQV